MTEKTIHDYELVERMIEEKLSDEEWDAFLDTACEYSYAELFEEVTEKLYRDAWAWADKLEVTLVALVNWYWCDED